MHASVMDWVKAVVDEYKLAGENVLEVGSYDVNGSVRPLFTGKYLGVDLRHGPGVDQVVEPAYLPFAAFEFSVVVCTEVLEHDPRPWLTVKEIWRVLKPDGYFLVTARGFGFPQHDFPADYWRFSPAAMEILLRDAGLDPLGVVADPDPLSPGVFAIAQKPR